MKDNFISIEIELIYFNEFIEPKKEVFKHDIEDYRKNLLESINYIKKNSINDLENVRKENSLKNEDIKNILFIILFWVKNEDVSFINDNGINGKINLKNIFNNENKSIKSVKLFIEEIVMKQTLYEMNNFFYDNIKCLSLYFFYCSFSDNFDNN